MCRARSVAPKARLLRSPALSAACRLGRPPGAGRQGRFGGQNVCLWGLSHVLSFWRLGFGCEGLGLGLRVFSAAEKTNGHGLCALTRVQPIMTSSWAKAAAGARAAAAAGSRAAVDLQRDRLEGFGGFGGLFLGLCCLRASWLRKCCLNPNPRFQLNCKSDASSPRD